MIDDTALRVELVAVRTAFKSARLRIEETEAENERLFRENRALRAYLPALRAKIDRAEATVRQARFDLASAEKNHRRMAQEWVDHLVRYTTIVNACLDWREAERMWEEAGTAEDQRATQTAVRSAERNLRSSLDRYVLQLTA